MTQSVEKLYMPAGLDRMNGNHILYLRSTHAFFDGNRCGVIDSLLTIEIEESSQVMVEQGTVLESLLGDLKIWRLCEHGSYRIQALATKVLNLAISNASH